MKKILILVVALLFVISCYGCDSIVNDSNNQSDNMLNISANTTIPSAIDSTIPQEVPPHTEYVDVLTPPDDNDIVISDSGLDEPIPPSVAEDVFVETMPVIEPQDADFVRIIDYIPTAVIDLRYAIENNFTGEVIYDFQDAWLRYGTVKKLMLVAKELEKQGLYLKIWDGFRPISAQFKLWDVYPDATFVANPNTGFSSHSRGNTIDVTLVDANGYELLMPTEFDDFSALANRSYNDCDPDAASNAILLENLMKKHGFEPYYNEWWHYSDTTSYEAEEMFDPATLG